MSSSSSSSSSSSDHPRLIAGAMSGTSADGADVAITRIDGRGYDMRPQLLLHHHRPYPRALRERIFAIRSSGSSPLGSLAELARDVSLVYAAAVNEALLTANISARDLAAVAAHGQTLFHDPPNTIQWLDPALLAAEVGAPVISDFRRADCAAGGQGAPLVPFADYILFRHPSKNRVLLNIGGIANLTYLPAGATIDQVIAFDTGPGNCISDHLCRASQPAGPGYDVDGAFASRGTAVFPIAFAVARSAFTFAKPPKSTDGPAMIATFDQFRATLAAEPTDLADLLATACLATVLSVELSLDLFAKDWRNDTEVYVSGGGTDNQFLMRALEEHLTENRGVTVGRLDQLGIPSQAKEAIAFALLGAATLDRVPANVPSVTGARRAVVLGCITPAP